jgi:hypothetical protein
VTSQETGLIIPEFAEKYQQAKLFFISPDEVCSFVGVRSFFVISVTWSARRVIASRLHEIGK